MNAVIQSYTDLSVEQLNKLSENGFELLTLWPKSWAKRYYFKESMDRFEYKIIKVFTELDERKLNAFGRRGYELVSIDLSTYGCKYYFKRKLGPTEKMPEGKTEVKNEEPLPF